MVLPFVLGLVMSYLGLIAPGMLNMTACNISLQRGLRQALIFSAGASSVVFAQAYIALFFAKYLNSNPDVIYYLKIGGIFVFIMLAIFFFIQANKKQKLEGNTKKKGNYFLIGMGMSIINMLAIPFYLGVGAFAESKGWLEMSFPDNFFFVLGAVIGAFGLLATYSYFAKVIMARSQFLSKNINYVLSALFLVLGIILLVKTWG